MKCLTQTCRRQAYSRGLCCAEYFWIWRRVQKGQVTWEALVAQGKVLASYRQRSHEREKRFGLEAAQARPEGEHALHKL